MRRIGQPTTRILGNIERFDPRETEVAKAVAGDFGPDMQDAILSHPSRYPPAATQSWAAKQMRPLVDGPVAPFRIGFPDTASAAGYIKDMARFFHADEVGIGEVPPFAPYKSTEPANAFNAGHKYAIAILVDQDYRTMRGSTGMDMISTSQNFRAYAQAAYIAVQLAHHIRSLGYSARAQIAGAYQVLVVPVLLYAGLGEIGRAGIVVNPRLGMRFKASLVTTDLPLAADQPVDFGLQGFCQQCQKCATYCPSRAIPSGPKVLHNGYETWKVDHEKCFRFRFGAKAGHGCGRCIKVCPWNRPDVLYHRLGIRLSERSRLAQKMLIWVDGALRSNLRAARDDRWWPIEEISTNFRSFWQPPADQWAKEPGRASLSGDAD